MKVGGFDGRASKGEGSGRRGDAALQRLLSRVWLWWANGLRFLLPGLSWIRVVCSAAKTCMPVERRPRFFAFRRGASNCYRCVRTGPQAAERREVQGGHVCLFKAYANGMLVCVRRDVDFRGDAPDGWQRSDDVSRFKSGERSGWMLRCSVRP
jgi:hypothetical protein